MFFKSNNITIDILSVLSLEWKDVNSHSGLRDFHALSFRSVGECEFINSDKSFHAQSGDISFVPKYYEYAQKSKKEELIVVHFDSCQDLPNEIKIFKSKNQSYFERKFKELYENWTKKQVGFEYDCKSILYKILMKIEREQSETKLLKSDENIMEAVDYIHDNFTESSLSIGKLAKMCNMSDTYFRRLFVRHFSKSPLKYIANLKVTYAKELLQSGYYNVQDIADMCGFNNAYYFSTFIKKETGHPPKYWIKGE